MTKRGVPEPWHPAPYQIEDIGALQALARGDASSEQQKRALDWIIMSACQTYDLAWRPGVDGARSTDFAAGRQFVGQQIVKLLKVRRAAGTETMHG